MPRVHQRIALVVNPTAGKGRGQRVGDHARALLRAEGHDVIDATGSSLHEARERAQDAIAAGADTLAVVGGDGIVNLGVDLCAGTPLRLAVVGAGTGNDFANNLGLPVHDPAGAVRIISGGVSRPVDAGVAVGADGSRRWFGGVLGAGFDALVTARAARMSWPRGQLRYTLAILRELPFFRPIPYVIELDDRRIETRAMLVAVANTTSFGGGMHVCPGADLADGLFDVLVLNEIAILEFLRVFPTVYAGRHVGHPAVEIHRSARVRLVAEGIEAQADGELFAPLPLEIENVPGALHVAVAATGAPA